MAQDKPVVNEKVKYCENCPFFAGWESYWCQAPVEDKPDLDDHLDSQSIEDDFSPPPPDCPLRSKNLLITLDEEVE